MKLLANAENCKFSIAAVYQYVLRHVYFTSQPFRALNGMPYVHFWGWLVEYTCLNMCPLFTPSMQGAWVGDPRCTRFCKLRGPTLEIQNIYVFADKMRGPMCQQ
jgi:hypothetical protein